LFLDYAASREPLAPFHAASPYAPVVATTHDGAQNAAIADLLEAQNRNFGAGEAALKNIAKLRAGAAAVVTGQQVTLFGGPLFTLLKAAAAIRRAKEAGAVPIFWMATEDHDLDEADHVSLPSRHELHTLRLQHSPDDSGKPVGSLRIGDSVLPLLEQASELLGPGAALDALQAAYTPEATYAEAFGHLLARVFTNEGLILIDAAGREFHLLGSRVLRAAIERAAEFEVLLLERARLLEERGYEAQVLVSEGGSLLFLIDDETGARLPLKRKDDSTWIAGRKQLSTEDLLAILESEPERLSPNALLRPVFQDSILPTAAYIGGPSEISYFAQSQVLYQAILGRTTPVLPRLSATLVESPVAKILAQHGLSLPEVIAAQPDELARQLGARILPEEGREKLHSAGNALDSELKILTEWLARLDAGLGKSAEVAAGKMRYQMDRLKRLASEYQLQKESSLRKHVDTLYLNLFPDRHPQERIIGAAAFLARSGERLVCELVELAGAECPGHKAIFL
jgi:bacillithiol biosynthesis cysteine-adding enzyme BshC